VDRRIVRPSHLITAEGAQMVACPFNQQICCTWVIFAGKKSKETGFVAGVLVVRAIEDCCDASDRPAITTSNESDNFPTLSVEQAVRFKKFADATRE